jgi:Tol biopolymer transport system component
MIPGRAPVLPEIRTQIPQPEGLTFNPGTQAIISPDGRWLAFPAVGPDNVARMYLRALDSLETKPLPGSEGIRAYSPPPFWSYDSRLVVYAAEDGKLRVSDVALTPARSIAHVGIPYAQGGTWSRDGVILYSANGELMRLSAQGGTPEAVTVRAPDERAQRYPQFLPDGKRFLYLRNWTADKSGIYVGSLDRKPEEQDTKPLLLTNRQAMWVKSEASGETYLLSQQGTNLVAQTFDPDTLELSGTPMTVATEVGSFAGASAGLWSVAATGTLIYRSGGQAQAEIIWRDAAGAAQGVIGTMGDYQTATLSPDGGKLAYRTADAGGNLDVWVRDLAKKSVARLTFDPGPDSFPVWSPDGQKIAFLSRRNGQWGLYEVSLAKPGEERLLFSSPDEMEPSSWSRDGLLAFTRVDSKGLESIWVLPVNGASMPCALDKKQFAEEEAMFSPNGRWIAYMARATGDQQVFVRSFSPENACAVSEKVISFGSGMSPRWNAAGDRLFYYDLNGNVMSVNVQTGANFQQDGAPRRLFGGISTDRTFHVAPKGDRFLVVEAAATNGPPPPFTMVQNWLGKLKK